MDCCISPGQHCAFRGSTGVPRQCLRAPDWLEQSYNGPGKYEPKRDISNEFGGSTGGEVQRGLIFVGVLFSSEIRVELLEIFVTAVLECSLGLDSMSIIIRAPPSKSIPSNQRMLGSTQ